MRAYNKRYVANGGKVTYSCKKCGITFTNVRFAWAHKTVLGHKVSYE